VRNLAWLRALGTCVALRFVAYVGRGGHMHRLQGCLVDRSYAGRLDYRLDVSVVRNCVILEFFDCYFDCYSVCVFSFVGWTVVFCVRVTGIRLGRPVGQSVVQQNREGHDASCLYSGPQCIIGHNNALQTVHYYGQ